MKLLLAPILALCALSTLQAQEAVRPFGAPAGQNGGGNQIIKEPPPPVIINNKPADKLTDDEATDFLQQKVKTVTQDDRQVKLIHIAPGYPITLFFDEKPSDVILGDKKMIGAQIVQNGLVLTADARNGDTSMQVLFGPERDYIYHIFIEPNFKDAETSIKIVSGSDPGPGGGGGAAASSGTNGLNIPYISQVLSNYDAMDSEGGIDHQGIRRTQIFRHSNITGFTYYDIYQFADGTVALTFAYRNSYDSAYRFDESRLRVTIGSEMYVPDYVSLNKTILGSDEATGGFLVLAKPAFSMKQTFELNWK
jgi:hypothetical protein